MHQPLRLIRNPQRSVSRDEVAWCYRTFLRREPESEAAIQSHLGHRSLRDLVQAFVESPEYKALRAQAQRPSESDALPGGPVPAARQYVSAQDNEQLAMAEHKEGVLYVRSTPRMVTLETTSRCNLRCVMCPHAIDAVDRPKHLEEHTIEGLTRFLGQAKAIQLHGIGEPLTSPAFWRSLDHLPAGRDSSINTNLTILDDKRLDRLIRSHIRFVNVSLDAATPLTYRRIRGFDFDTVVGNIRRFVAARQTSGKRTPLLYMNMTMMRANIEELPAFVELAAGLGADKVCLWHLNQWPDAEMQRYRIDRDGWRFDYAQEGLWNHPALSNRMVREAQLTAKRCGIGLYLDENKDVFFDEASAPKVGV